jgi:ABC-type phosphate transport system substrate-binding protein
MSKRDFYILLLFATVLFGAVCTWNMAVTADDQIAIIVNPANSVSTLSPGDLHKIFMGDKGSWPNGKHIFLIMAPSGSPERAAMLKSVFKMSEGEYAKYFLQATFTGAISAPPKEASSAAEIKQLVAANAGAIGYVKPQDADDTVKVLLKVP